jgi:hypothetical protein
MHTLGYQITEDGVIKWRLIGWRIERRDLYALETWTAAKPLSPRTPAELEDYCRRCGTGYASMLRGADLARKVLES